MAQQDRIEQFKKDVAEMGVADPSTGRDRVLLAVGAVLLVVGPVVSIIGYSISHGTSNPLQQNDATITAIIGLAVTVVGGSLFVRYSVARFFRFWLARLSYEQHAQTDRLIEAMRGVVAAPSEGPKHAAADGPLAGSSTTPT